MPERSPLFIYFYILSVCSLLLGLSFLVPAHDVSLPFGFHFKYPTFRELWEVKTHDYADISGVVAMADSLSEAEKIEESEAEVANPYVWLKPHKSKKINVDSLRAEQVNIQRIEFSDGNATSLYQFFDALNTCIRNGSPTHIFHYGDSQIEGDRMTSYVRDKLQKRFGGSGIGMLSLCNQNVVPLVNQECSDNWLRYPVFGKDAEKQGNQNFGAMAAYSSYTQFPTDSILENRMINLATVKFDLSKAIYNNAKRFNRATLYYGPVMDPVRMSYKCNDTMQSMTLKGTALLNKSIIDCQESTTELTLAFDSKISPQFYGVSFDAGRGVAMTNVPMRGGSGTVFHKIDRDLLRAMYSETNTSFIIMQYGGNVLPYIKDEQACIDYGLWFYNQIIILKSACPNASILIVGPADMSMKSDQFYETYTYLESVRDALRESAFKAHVGFWDTYKAMGGMNSMPSWVEADPPLAGTDYTHFTPRGARIISELLYKAIIVEYENYMTDQEKLKQIP